MGLLSSHIRLLALAAALSLSVVCGETTVRVESPETWRFLGRNEQPLGDAARSSIEFSAGRIRCERYCLGTPGGEAKFLKVVWKLGRNFGAEMGSDASSDNGPIKTNASRNSQCRFSITAECSKIPEDAPEDKAEENFVKTLLQPSFDADAFLNFSNEKRLVERSELENAAEVDFLVQPRQAEVNVIILGNVSEIDLKIPVDAEESASSLGTTTRLSLGSGAPLHEERMPTGFMRLKVRNPPPGGWRLALKGMKGEKYRVVASSTQVPLTTRALNGMHKESGMSSRQMKLHQRSGDREYMMMYDDEDDDNAVHFPDSPALNLSSRVLLEDRILSDRSALSEDSTFSNLGTRDIPLRKYLTVELNPSSNLIATPGSSHRLVFDITNNHVLPVRHVLSFRSSQLPIRITPSHPTLPPNVVDVYPGHTVSVTCEVLIPPIASESSTQKVSLYVEGLLVGAEKTVQFYVRSGGNRIFDDVKPYLNYWFANNCNGRTGADKCAKSIWSVDITVQDSESGLKSVTSSPTGTYAFTDYVSGTNSPVYFYYSNTCCNRALRISATDLAGNVYSQDIDVGVWWNLSGGEITAIVFGILLLILLIALIVLSVLYCRHKHSHDLPYSQRYGSRSSPRSPSE